ncbi:MAG TPA: cytochrome c [Acidobacteriaceae bacterium]|nr:cytochrome c [Acidobacteriaceae bacterium]
MRGIRQEGSGVRSAARRQTWILGAGMTAMLLLSAGCRQDMQDEPKFVPQRGTTFFSDNRSVRPQVEHTVARGQLDQDSYFNTGLEGGKEADMMPFPVTMQVLARGQERFNIYCTPCHSRVGNGAGMIVQRGYKPAANFHDARHLAQPVSHFFYVMTNGFGAMPDYSAQLPPADRWAVAAYIRALQMSQDAGTSSVPAGVQVQDLKDIAQQEGYPESFAGPWALPQATHAVAQPADPSQGNPGMAPANENAPPVWNAAPVNAETNGKPAPRRGVK